MSRCLLAGLLVLLAAPMGWSAEGADIARRLPPQGVAIDPAERDALTTEAKKLRARCEKLADNELLPDAEILVKAVEYALLHDEFYKAADTAIAHQQLKLATERLADLERGAAPWHRQTGQVVRGYRSVIDDSPQPYGLQIPADLRWDQAVPLYVWLHGRGDKQTDLHFIQQRLARAGQIAPQGAIVVHPFGRQCVGFKSAGEIDVLEVVAEVQKQYKIDPQRIVLMGFSMGGAGCWHLGAHYPDRWVAMSPGAGFAETARYQKLKPESFPPTYEQTLWGLYDVPDYVRNLFNLPVIAYSGEVDAQIQAARVMEEAFDGEGQKLTHLIGPGMGHKYHPETLNEILTRVNKYVKQGRNPQPRSVSLQTRTLRYPQVAWVRALGLGEHWKDSRIDAHLDRTNTLHVVTKNITELQLSPPQEITALALRIDNQPLTVARFPAVLQKTGSQWSEGSTVASGSELLKSPGLQGPIDDVFYQPFLVVTPTGQSKNPSVDAWVKFELPHQIDRWRALFRGELPVKKDVDVTPEDIAGKHLILWGDVDSNGLISQVNDQLPIRYVGADVVVGSQKHPRSSHVPVLIYPNPLNPAKYIVLNSGPTFREDHDRTNSLQNPKLPDWAVIDIRTPPSGSSAGRVVEAGFFNEQWKLKSAE